MRIILRTFIAWALVSLCTSTTFNAEASGKASLSEALEAHRGKIILLDFWASWCGPCQRSFPWMNKMLTRYEADGLVIVSVNLDKSHEDATNFLEQNNALFEVFFDPLGEGARSYDVRTMPTSFLLDRSGKIVARHRGFLTSKESIYEHSLVKALALDRGANEKIPNNESNHKVSYEN